MANVRQKWGSSIHTLDSIDSYNRAITSTAGYNGATKETRNNLLQTQHIPDLSDSEAASNLLKRIRCEFLPIVERRGYIVNTLTEMCCCGDGLDHVHVTVQSNNITASTKKKQKRGRKTRLMPDNVLGYNLTHGYRKASSNTTNTTKRQSTHRIHLRLRHPKTHVLYCYEEVAGTMAHELAHCEHGAHNAKFYKLMDEILEQHAVLMTKGLVVDADGFPMNSPEAYTLGSLSSSVRSNAKNVERSYDRNKARKAAQQRMERQKLGLGGTFVLGSKATIDNGTRNGLILPSLVNLSPREAARVAAERRVEERRIADSQFCLPCNEIIELLDESDEETDEYEGVNKQNDDENNDDVVQSDRKKQSSSFEVIELDDDELGVALDDSLKVKPFVTSATGSSGAFTSSVSVSLTNKTPSLRDSSNFGKIRDRSFENNTSNNDKSFRKRSLHKISIQNHDAKRPPVEEKQECIDLTIDDKSDNLNGDGFDKNMSGYGNVKNISWSCSTCTCINSFPALSCVACGKERDITQKDMISSIGDTTTRSTDSITIEKSGEMNNKGPSFWSCPQCTCHNPRLSLCCKACGRIKSSLSTNALFERTSIPSESEDCRSLKIIEKLKEKEVEKSKLTFGFNIYGSESRSSRTMNHIT